MTKVNEQVIGKRAFGVRGLSDSEYENIKALAKKELPFRVSIRRWKRNYAMGQIDIRPYGKGIYRWTSEEFKTVLAFVERHNLLFNTARTQPKNWELCYNNGFTFVGYLAK